MRKLTCKCGKIKERPNSGSCNGCHSAYTKKWKKSNPLTVEQKEKAKITRKKYEDVKREGIRKRRPRIGAKPGILRPLCSWCDEVIENFKKKNYCKKCSAKYNREWRKLNPRSLEDKFKDNVRTKTRYRIARGILIKKPCELCGELKVEAHHEDYNKPFDIRWLCIRHHHELHGRQRRLNGTSNKDNQSINS